MQGWISIVGGLLASTAVLASFAYSTFTTKHESEMLNHRVTEIKSDTTLRLDRIENKIDRLLQK